tara:strand:+ start:407 stop:1246 length:840 start_codon:yes stop_codon:yes gene_type:complete
MENFDAFIDSLADHEPVVKTSSTRKTFPCGQCAGTGKWSGGTNRHGNSNCLACKGKGYFMTSREDRNKLKTQRVARKVANKESLKSDFISSNEGLIEGLQAMQWHNKASSLLEGFAKYGSLTEGQIKFARLILAGQAERDAKRAAADAAPKAKVDLARVEEIFSNAKTAGKKSPKLRLDGMVLSLAGANSKNAGAIYVKAGSDYEAEYYGKVMSGEFHKMRSAPDSITTALQALAADPLSSAVAYGRTTGTCACCGRELTNKESIDRGIGPICAENWGI